MIHAIVTERLCRRYGGICAVDGIDLLAPDRSVYGFIGRNGAGKTTTIRMLLGLVRPTAGRVLICGFDLLHDRIKAARLVGSVLDGHGLYGNLTGRENLSITARLLGVSRTEPQRVLEVVELGGAADRPVRTYSLGMRQRLGLARALMGAPRLLILDEPMNGLDPEGIRDMRDLLRNLPERMNATVFVSSHLLSEVEQIATHIGVIERGRLLLQDSLAAVKRRVGLEVRIGVDAPQRAIEIAKAAGFRARLTPDAIIVRLNEGDDERGVSAHINRTMNESNIGVFTIEARSASLEAVFEGLTDESKIT